jgi:hypothetical protein
MMGYEGATEQRKQLLFVILVASTHQFCLRASFQLVEVVVRHSDSRPQAQAVTRLAN